jgi:hypothetical protein
MTGIRDYKEASLYFEYDENSPSGLKWKENSGWTGKYFKRFQGTYAGSKCKNQKRVFTAWVMRVNSKNYLAHRIIWCLFNGNIDESLNIDHIDGNPLNNKIDNLRLITQTINNRNHAKQVNNKTGKTGVSRLTTRGVEYYSATWSEPLKGARSKRFSIKKYGEAKAFELASEYRDMKMAEFDQLGLTYSDRHGL